MKIEVLRESETEKNEIQGEALESVIFFKIKEIFDQIHVLGGALQQELVHENISLDDIRNQVSDLSVQSEKGFTLLNTMLKSFVYSDKNQTDSLLSRAVCHDLRTPFNSILGLLELIHMELNEPIPSIQEIKESTEVMVDGITKGGKLVEKLLQDAGSDHIEIQPVSVSESLNLPYLESIAAQKDIQIDSSRIDREVHISTDPRVLDRVVFNLVRNAIKFSYQGSKIFIKASQTDTGAEITVQDQGIGMREDISSNLFKEPISNHQLGTNNEEGRGVGLFLLGELIQQTRGSIRVWSREHVGSQFTLSYPKAS